jgi:hypothetical protein
MKRPRAPKHQHPTDKEAWRYLKADELTAWRYLNADENLAFEYLAGKFMKDEHGKITHRFHKPGSEEEARSRATLVKLLREPGELHPFIRSSLAELLDPDSLEERKFMITNRRSGKQPRHAFMIAIAWSIALQIADGRKIESVKQEAKDLYGVSMSTINRAWVDHKDSELIGPMWKAARY